MTPKPPSERKTVEQAAQDFEDMLSSEKWSRCGGTIRDAVADLLLEYTAQAREEGRLEGIERALQAGIARASEGFCKNPLPSMSSTEVKNHRDAMLSGAHKVFDAIRALAKDGGKP